jgi:hypothetical protein
MPNDWDTRIITEPDGSRHDDQDRPSYARQMWEERARQQADEADAKRSMPDPEGTYHREVPTVHGQGAGTYHQQTDRVTPGPPQLPTNAILDHHFANIRDKKTVQQSDGRTSSVKTIIVEFDGKPTVIPTIWDGRELSKDEAVKRALKSGKNWPRFDTNDEADAADAEWHKYMSVPGMDSGQGPPADYPYQAPESEPMQSDFTSETPPMEPLPKTFRQSAIEGLGEARDMQARRQEMINATMDIDYANEP